MIGETTLCPKGALSAAAITTANVFGKMGADDDHIIVAAAASDLISCVIAETATAAEESIRCEFVGIVDIVLGGTVTRGAKVTSDSSGRAVTAAAGENIGGVILASGVVNDIVPMLISIGIHT